MKTRWIWIKNILIPLILGGLIGLIISKTMDYNELIKPPLSPPGYLFGIVWTILYILMGVSYSILDVKNLITTKEKNIYYLQLAVNLLWPIIFFTLKWRLFAGIWIVLLLVLIIYMIILFYKKNKIAAYLQIPYLLWTIFATYLSFGVYILNK